MIKKFLLVILIAFLVSACALPAPTTTPVPTAVPPTETAVPEPTSTPTIVPTATVTLIPLSDIPYPQSWERVAGECGQEIVIEAVQGDAFTGKFIEAACHTSSAGTSKMKGTYVKSVDNFAADLIYWLNVEGYENGPQSGLWLKWQNTYAVGGGLSGWYYANIRDDLTMTVRYYYTDDPASLDETTSLFKLK